MGAQAEAGNPTELRQPASCIYHVIDIASPEELFEHDGPLLAEDSEMYHFRNSTAFVEPEPEAQAPPQVNGTEWQETRVEEHVKKVMEQIKARKQDEVLRRFDSAMRTAANRVDLLDHVDVFEDHSSDSADQLVKDTMASLQAAQERLELRNRATAALQAATERAASTREAKVKSASRNEVRNPSGTQAATKAPATIKAGPAVPLKTGSAAATQASVHRPKDSDCKSDEQLQARIQKALKAAHSRHASEVKPEKHPTSQTTADAAKRLPAAPEPSATSAVKSTKASETLQDHVSRVMAEARRRSLTVQDTKGVQAGENLEEQTTTASSYSATDSGSEESGGELQPTATWWGPAPR